MELGQLSFRPIDAVGVGGTHFCLSLLSFLCINTALMPMNTKLTLHRFNNNHLHTCNPAEYKPKGTAVTGVLL